MTFFFLDHRLCQTTLSERSEGTPMKGFSAHHNCFLMSLLFPLAYFLHFLYHPFSVGNSFHSLLYSMMLLASGALYSNVFHMLTSLLCEKGFAFFFFSSFLTF